MSWVIVLTNKLKALVRPPSTQIRLDPPDDVESVSSSSTLCAFPYDAHIMEPESYTYDTPLPARFANTPHNVARNPNSSIRRRLSRINIGFKKRSAPQRTSHDSPHRMEYENREFMTFGARKEGFEKRSASQRTSHDRVEYESREFLTSGARKKGFKRNDDSIPNDGGYYWLLLQKSESVLSDMQMRIPYVAGVSSSQTQRRHCC
jgi:hypothetical protein